MRQMELQHKEQLARQREEIARLHAEHEEVVAHLLEQLRRVSPKEETNNEMNLVNGGGTSKDSTESAGSDVRNNKLENRFFTFLFI